MSSPVQEDAVDLLMCDGSLAATRGHLERSQEVGDEHLQLAHVLSLLLDELEDNAIAFAQVLGVRRLNVLLDDTLPALAIQPAFAQALHLAYTLQLGRLVARHGRLTQHELSLLLLRQLRQLDVTRHAATHISIQQTNTT